MQKNNSIKLLFFFVLAVTIVIVILNFIFGLIVHFLNHDQSIWWHSLTLAVIIFVLSLVTATSLFKYLIYKNGGNAIAQHLNASQISTIDAVPEALTALKLNRELAELCDVPAATLFVLNNELGINALTVGQHKNNVSIILTWGALQSMNQDELKGMLAHEYVHITTGSYIDNTKLEILFSGLLIIGQMGSYFIKKGTKHRNLILDSLFSAIFVALGGFIWLIGSLGVIVSRMLKSLYFHMQDYDIDDEAAELLDQQYILHALTRLYVHKEGSHIYRVEAESLAHYCFANALSEQSWFKTHPSLSQRISYLHPGFGRKAAIKVTHFSKNWQRLLERILLPTRERDLIENIEAQQRKHVYPFPLPLLRLSPISFATKDAVRPLSPDIRQLMERPELLKRAMQTATGSREVVVAIFMIRQYREFIPDDAQVSKAIVEVLLKLDGRVHVQIFHEAIQNIDYMPTIMSRQYIHRIIEIIQADGEIGLLDCLLLDRIKAIQHLLEDAMPIARQNCTEAIVHLVDALLHVQQINTQSQLDIRKKILEQLLTFEQQTKYSQVIDKPLDLAKSVAMISGMLMRERLYLLTVTEHTIWSDRAITQDELDVLELLYWRLGFESEDLINRMLKQNSLLIT